MQHRPPSVKTSRRYDSSRRRDQASRTRDAIVGIARRRFLADGYAATTLQSIATEAGVSVETVYKAFGSKSGLVRAIQDRALAGDDAIPTERRSDAMRLAEADPRRIIENWGRFTGEVSPRVAPVLLLVNSAAATDPEMARLSTELDDERLARMTVNARHLADHGHLREDVSVEQARDVLWLYSSPQLYELLVIRQGWPIERYVRFVTEAMITALIR